MGKTTNKADEIFVFIKDYSKSFGYAPSIREICTRVRLQSTSSVYYHLKKLCDQGKISMIPSQSRSITILEHEKGIPIVGNVAAGQPITATEHIDGYLDFSQHDDLFALRVKGDSMVDIGIFSGDMVMVRPANVANNGDIVVAMIDEEATVKRYHVDGGQIYLLPENKNYAPIDGNYATILGIVCGLYRLF